MSSPSASLLRAAVSDALPTAVVDVDGDAVLLVVVDGVRVAEVACPLAGLEGLAERIARSVEEAREAEAS